MRLPAFLRFRPFISLSASSTPYACGREYQLRLPSGQRGQWRMQVLTAAGCWRAQYRVGKCVQYLGRTRQNALEFAFRPADDIH